MKSLIRFVCLSLIFFAVEAVAYDAPDNFRGLKWGTSLDMAPQTMRLVEDDGDVKYYSSPEEKMSIGDTKLARVTYGFYKNRFYQVFIQFDGLENFNSLLQTLVDAYGTPDQPNEFMDDYFWGVDITAPVLISIEYSDFLKKGMIEYSYRPIDNEVDEDLERKESRDAGKDL